LHEHGQASPQHGILGFLVGDLLQDGDAGPVYLVIDSIIRLNQAIYGDRTHVVVSKIWDRVQQELAGSSGGHLLGWYHSHPPQGIALAPGDIETHLEFFQQPWHVALVLGVDANGAGAALYRPANDALSAITCLPFYEVAELGAVDGKPVKRSALPWSNFITNDPVVYGTPEAADAARRSAAGAAQHHTTLELVGRDAQRPIPTPPVKRPAALSDLPLLHEEPGVAAPRADPAAPPRRAHAPAAAAKPGPAAKSAPAAAPQPPQPPQSRAPAPLITPTPAASSRRPGAQMLVRPAAPARPPRRSRLTRPLLGTVLLLGAGAALWLSRLHERLPFLFGPSSAGLTRDSITTTPSDPITPITSGSDSVSTAFPDPPRGPALRPSPPRPLPPVATSPRVRPAARPPPPPAHQPVPPPPALPPAPLRPPASATVPLAPERTGFVSGVGQRGLVGKALALPLVFGVRDTANRPLSGIEVSFFGSNAVIEPSRAVTDASGQTRIRATLGPVAGAASVIARVGPLTRTASLTVVAGPPSQISFSCGTERLTRGVAVAAGTRARLEVRVQDALGNDLPVTRLSAAAGDEGLLRVEEVQSEDDRGSFMLLARRAGTTSLAVLASGVRGTLAVRIEASGLAGCRP
jgi:hypothetical protein